MQAVPEPGVEAPSYITFEFDVQKELPFILAPNGRISEALSKLNSGDDVMTIGDSPSFYMSPNRALFVCDRELASVILDVFPRNPVEEELGSFLIKYFVD